MKIFNCSTTKHRFRRATNINKQKREGKHWFNFNLNKLPHINKTADNVGMVHGI